MNSQKKITALKVHQWLDEWDEIRWNRREKRAEPQHWFYQFNISARDLLALSGIYARSTNRDRGSDDTGIQRRHEKSRSTQIRQYVEFGYPWSELSKTNRESGDYNDLRKPGWLPTAIVINILRPNDLRKGIKLKKPDAIRITDRDIDSAEIFLPSEFTGRDWEINSLPPIEVIDGQHRLWAFSEHDIDENFQLPVIAFHGLDLSWQAYLFYTINIKPKKINASLAFDLYPLLRSEVWMEKFEGHSIYREARAQELVDLLWSYTESPWHKRINMLGEPGHKGMVSQAAWVRSLLASFVKSWEGRGVSKLGGVFGSAVGEHETVLPWTRTEQVAFLIFLFDSLQKAVLAKNTSWTKALRDQSRRGTRGDEDDMAFYGPNSLISQDQGVRIVLQVFNDLIFVSSEELLLDTWGGVSFDTDSDPYQIKKSRQTLQRKSKLVKFVDAMTNSLANIDWRSSSAPGLTEEQRILKASFRGGGGYKELRIFVLTHLSKSRNAPGLAARDVLSKLVS